MRASQFIIEALDSDAVNELDLYIMNNEDLYRRRFMPIITNIRRKLKRNIYDHNKVIKLWMYLVDDAAREYVKEFGSKDQDVKDLMKSKTKARNYRSTTTNFCMTSLPFLFHYHLKDSTEFLKV